MCGELFGPAVEAGKAGKIGLPIATFRIEPIGSRLT
jgi:hypothetical protein